MDDKTAFLELSALLTGLDKDMELNAVKKILNTPAAELYGRLLTASFGGKLTALLDAYRTLAAATPTPAIDDTLLTAFKATPAFQNKDNEFVARQMVNIWYFSQYRETATGPFLDGGFYERGFAWDLIKAHPIGFSNEPTGYWAAKPA
jgi:hypothetical protein